METYEDILKRKQAYYGKTKAAYEFAAIEYAVQKMIEENRIIMQIENDQKNGIAVMLLQKRIHELEAMIKETSNKKCTNLNAGFCMIKEDRGCDNCGYYK